MRLKLCIFVHGIYNRLSVDKRNIEAWLGLCAFNRAKQNAAGMLDALTQAASVGPNSLAVHIGRCEAYLLTHAWAQCEESARRCVTIDDGCIEGHLYLTIYALCFDGSTNESESALSQLIDAITGREPNNVSLKLRVARIISRCATGRQSLLNMTKQAFH